jgi:mannose-1-phosphate guanylyltransferase
MAGQVWGVVLAGGRGTRFWPVSTRSTPKQFLDMLGEGTLLQNTFRRVNLLCPPERILVVTGAEHSGEVEAQLPGMPRRNILLEPVPRNTAASIGWAAHVISLRGGPEDTMIVVPSDHAITPDQGFAETLERAVAAAARGWLMTVGVPPDRPATGYGYLEKGEEVGGFWKVSSFREKPDLATAEIYVSGGRHFWNAGIFAWRADGILREIGRSLPCLHGSLLALTSEPLGDTGLFEGMPSVSIDYGVMEKAENVGMVEALFKWDDVGDWPAARRSGIGRGEVAAFESRDFTVWAPGSLTVLLGVSDISVVSANGVILVMNDAYSQKLRDVVAWMEKEKPGLV